MHLKISVQKWKFAFVCMPWRPIAVTAGICLIFGILTALSGGYYPIHYCLPRGVLPMAPIILFWFAEYILIGGAGACFFCSPVCRKAAHFQERICLFLGILMLSYAWIPLVLRAGSLFSGFLLCPVLLLLLLFLAFSLRKALPVAAFCLALCAGWAFYMLIYTLLLLLLNK